MAHSHCEIGTIYFKPGYQPRNLNLSQTFVTHDGGYITRFWKLTGVRSTDGVLRFERNLIEEHNRNQSGYEPNR